MSSSMYYNTGHVILNIGLVRADNKQPMNPTFVEQYLAHIGLDVREFRLFVSDSEPTAVVVVRTPSLWAEAARASDIAHFLRQDAIAVWAPEINRGFMEGRNAAVWGSFNPQYFLMPDGTRLGAAL